MYLNFAALLSMKFILSLSVVAVERISPSHPVTFSFITLLQLIALESLLVAKIVLSHLLLYSIWSSKTSISPILQVIWHFRRPIFAFILHSLYAYALELRTIFRDSALSL